MQRRNIAVILAFTLTLTVALAGLSPFAYASCVRSIPYTTFNSSAFTSYALDKDYEGFYSEVVNKLVYANSSTWAIVRFHLNASTAAGPYLELAYDADKELHIKYNDTTSYIEIGSGYWETGNATYVYLTSDGILSVKDYQGNYIIQNYGVGAQTLYYVGGLGAAGYTTSGYVTISVQDYTSADVSSTITPWIGVIVTFAMLSFALGMIKKFT
jgi:hypothetical protein